MKLKDKRAVITGGTQGLGKALAQRFVAEGAHVAICARNTKELERTKEELSASGAKVLTVACDIAISSKAADFVEHAARELGSIDILVNNASLLGERVSIAEYPIGVWDEVLQANINGPFFVLKAVLPIMIKQGSGCIINVSSSVGRVGRARWGAYAVSKFALEGLTQVLAEEVRPSNITVNSVNPGPMATAMRRAAYPSEDQSILRTPQQLTEVFVYLASSDGVGITGQAFDASTYIANPRVFL